MIGVENTINLWFKQTLTLIGNCFILVCEFKTLNCFYRHTRFMVVREEKLRHFSKRGQETVLSLWCIYDILCYEGRKVNLFNVSSICQKCGFIIEFEYDKFNWDRHTFMLCQNTEVFSLNSRMCTKNLIAF